MIVLIWSVVLFTKLTSLGKMHNSQFLHPWSEHYNKDKETNK